MIPRLPGWQWIAERGHVVLLPPDVELGAIRYLARQHSLAPIAELVERHQPGARLVGAPQLLVTREGEYAAIAITDTTIDSCALRGVLGFVLGDDEYACIEGVCAPAKGDELARTIRDLVNADTQQRGVRRRRFRFTPPPWPAHMLGDHVLFVAPDRGSRITVHPGIPFDTGVAVSLDLQRLPGEDILVAHAGPSSGFRIVHDGPTMPIATSSRLAGTRVRVTGRWDHQLVERDIVMLRDDRYAYAVELTSDPAHVAAATAVFEQLVASIEPIPYPARPAASPTSAFNHWAD